MLFQTCVLGLPCKVEIRFESSASHSLGLLDLFATQSNKSNIIVGFNFDVCLKIYHDWIVVAYIEWLIDQNLES